MAVAEPAIPRTLCAPTPLPSARLKGRARRRRGVRVLLVLLLALGSLAGCLSSHGHDVPVSPPGGRPLDPLTNATFHLGPFIATRVASFDGTGLHIDVQLPDGPGPFPTLLTDTPYSLLGEDAAGAQADLGRPFGGGYVSEYVPRGYAVAVAHVRGTGESGGCLTIGDPAEGKDGYALVEWIANQTWSNGKVAMIGTSYDGTTPLETAVWNPPHLTTIVPISPVTEWYRYYFELGTHRRNADPFPGSSDTDPALWAAMGITPGVRTGATGGVDDARCPADYTFEDDAQDDYDAFWHARDHHAKAGNITAPMLFAHGWEDGNVAPSGFPSLWANVTSEKRLWLEQHGHGVPASKTAYHEYQHRWLDYWLLGKQNGALLLPPVVIEDNDGKFRAEQDWPPRDATALRLNLSSDAMRLVQDVPAGQDSFGYQDLGTGNEDDTMPDKDHASFETPPLAAPLHLAGIPVLGLNLRQNMPGGQFDANLYDVAPDGAQAYLSRGFLDARHRASLDHGADMPSLQAVDVRIPLHGNDHVVPAGHHLRLVLKGSDDYVQRSPYRPLVAVTIAKGLSWLDLPVVPDASRPASNEAPHPWSP
jgi:X-Pro dipeptidyl-peptidase